MSTSSIFHDAQNIRGTERYLLNEQKKRVEEKQLGKMGESGRRKVELFPGCHTPA